MPIFRRYYWIFWGSISLKAFSSSFCAPTELDPLSLHWTPKFTTSNINRYRAFFLTVYPCCMYFQCGITYWPNIWRVQHISWAPFYLLTQMGQKYQHHNWWMVVQVHLFPLTFLLQQPSLDKFSYQTSYNGTALDYLKTITSNFIYGKSSSPMGHFLMTPLYNNLVKLLYLPISIGWTSLMCRFDAFSLPLILIKPFLSR